MFRDSLHDSLLYSIISVRVSYFLQFHPNLVKGVPVLESGSASEYETLTVRFATLENPENFGRKYLAAHPDEITVISSFFGSGDKRATFPPSRVKLTQLYLYSYMR